MENSNHKETEKEPEITGPADVLKLFCDDSFDDSKLLEGEFAGKILKTFVRLGDGQLKGKCFLGVNVRTNAKEALRPISFRLNANNPYQPNPDNIDEGGRITDMEILDSVEDFFRWNPDNWDPDKPDIQDPEDNAAYNGAVYPDDPVSMPTILFFKNKYGKTYNRNSSTNKLNILGDIYDNALELKGDCYVWLFHMDYDINNGAKSLSFVLAVCEKKEDIDFIRTGAVRNDLINYVMLVKARYVRTLQKLRQVESVKSAVAAIMSRNMSHNLGSHYLYYTKNQLAKLADECQQQMAPDIRGAAKVLGYMQARMDYLATIVSGDKYPYGSVYFKGQIFDELTIDDFSKRHFAAGKDADGKERKFKRITNYLLQNIILSENFTREPIIDGEEDLSKKNGNKVVRLQILTKDGCFTGLAQNAGREEGPKLDISKLSIALPGGIMSIHAFYNVLENFIRNSAKYRKGDFKKELIFTIAINEISDKEGTQEKKGTTSYEFVIFDNKANAFKPYVEGKGATLLSKMQERLGELKILNENNELDKESKGLKEMLFSTLWMRTYAFDKERQSNKKAKYMSDILVEMEQKKGQDKIDMIKTYAFEYVAVDDQGHIINQNKGVPCNLGIRFEIPKFKMMSSVTLDDMSKKEVLKEKGLNNFTDILCVDDEKEALEELKSKDSKAWMAKVNEREVQLAELKKRFTRVCQCRVTDEDSEKEAVERLKSVLRARFDDFDSYQLAMESKEEEGFDQCEKKKFGIYFETHLASKETMEEYAYSEAISGENFTKTMQGIFNNGLIGCRYQTEADEYFGLKIKESALTRITIIDERLFNNMQSHADRGDFLRYKNIRVLNLKNNPGTKRGFILSWFEKRELKVEDLFEGNRFNDGTNATHFLSIHLGMIEKIVKDDSPWIQTFKLEKAGLSQRVEQLMAWLRDSFSSSKGEVYISIHSGRGNFSPELDDALKEYPFISVSALEAVYSNSKFLLAQLFYNTVYIGKGILNEQ